jgi:hypothetical protein
MPWKGVCIRWYSIMTATYCSNVAKVDTYNYKYRAILLLITVGIIARTGDWNSESSMYIAE